MPALTLGQKENIIKKIDEFLESKTLNTLNEKELEYISKQLLVDRLKNELNLEIKRTQVDLDSLQDRWINGFKSSATRETYGKGLQIFFDWLELQQKDVFNINALDADDYVRYLNKQYTMDNSIRERIAAVSSFFSFLERHDIINKNHFKGCRRPPRPFETKNSEEIPEEEDLNTIIKALYEELNAEGRGSAGKRRQARTLIAVISVIQHQGIRCGALPSFTIDKNGRYTAESKGREVRGTINEETRNILDTLSFDVAKPFWEMKVNTIQKSFERFCKRLYLEGKITTVYSLHDLRHYAAVRHYEEEKDIISTQRYLGHGSVATTQVYLATINVVKKD